MNNSRYMNLNSILKILTILFLVAGIYFLASPSDLNIQKYYDILDSHTISEEKKTKDVKVDLKALSKCKLTSVGNSSEECYKNFYEKYTVKYGPELAFTHLHLVMNDDPEIIPGCHYISHGIGAGALEYYNGDVGKSYTFDVAKYFSNIGSCGNGYHHGISIGMTRNAKTDDELYNILNGFCDKKLNKYEMGTDSCNHGLGHAITLYYYHDLPKSVSMCHSLYPQTNEGGFFGCMTGVRMEYGMYLDYMGLWTEKGVEGLRNLCSEYSHNTEEREACIVEGSGVVRYGENYIKAVKDCQTLDTPVDRKACTKLTVIHAIRLGRSIQASDLCKIPNARAERIECTAFMANYLALSLDISKGKMFYGVNSNVCHSLNIVDYFKCIAISRNWQHQTFRSDLDRGTMLTLEDIRNLYKFYKGYFMACNNCVKATPSDVDLINRM